MLILSKILLALAVVGLLWFSEKFRRMSRDLDDEVFASVKRIMHATEDCGYPRHLIPLLMLVTALCFVLSAYVTAAGAR